MYKAVNTSDLSTTWEEVETPIKTEVPTANQVDTLTSQEKDEDTSFKEFEGKRAIKGFLIAIPISIALWCIIISISLAIF